ncbi:hypothetical protein AGLY_005948 [Aphis glycines]|uniref:Uncharacterized protein n=1 Tax=Aphis glycines TaxID=307491 RepID=A0A6G0TUN6_APHGL|nr:hypothetical protein AGLY_005948 [Aphis glycines]
MTYSILHNKPINSYRNCRAYYFYVQTLSETYTVVAIKLTIKCSIHFKNIREVENQKSETTGFSLNILNRDQILISNSVTLITNLCRHSGNSCKFFTRYFSMKSLALVNAYIRNTNHISLELLSYNILYEKTVISGFYKLPTVVLNDAAVVDLPNDSGSGFGGGGRGGGSRGGDDGDDCSSLILNDLEPDGSRSRYYPAVRRSDGNKNFGCRYLSTRIAIQRVLERIGTGSGDGCDNGYCTAVWRISNVVAVVAMMVVVAVWMWRWR